jgi:hypothetical protein
MSDENDYQGEWRDVPKGPYIVEVINSDFRAGFSQILEKMLNQWAGMGYELHTINGCHYGFSTELFYGDGRGLPLFTYLVIARKKETIADQSD